jgi:hypothetical protein
MSILHLPFTFLSIHLLVETIGDSSSGRLVDDTEDVHTGYGTRVLGSLLMGVVEVRGDDNDACRWIQVVISYEV